MIWQIWMILLSSTILMLFFRVFPLQSVNNTLARFDGKRLLFNLKPSFSVPNLPTHLILIYYIFYRFHLDVLTGLIILHNYFA